MFIALEGQSAAASTAALQAVRAVLQSTRPWHSATDRWHRDDAAGPRWRGWD